MNSLLIFLSVFCSDNTIYIAIDDSMPSRIVKSEMNRNWIKNDNVSEVTVELAEMRCLIVDKVKLVYFYDYKECNKHRVPRLKEYPMYRVGEYGEFTSFDKRSFNASGSAMQTIYAIKINSDIDMNDYKLKCEELIKNANYNFMSAILQWGIENSIDDVNAIYTIDDGDINSNIDVFIKKYSHRKDFPKFKQPEIPKNPLIKFPWE